MNNKLHFTFFEYPWPILYFLAFAFIFLINYFFCSFINPMVFTSFYNVLPFSNLSALWTHYSSSHNFFLHVHLFSMSFLTLQSPWLSSIINFQTIYFSSIDLTNFWNVLWLLTNLQPTIFQSEFDITFIYFYVFHNFTFPFCFLGILLFPFGSNSLQGRHDHLVDLSSRPTDHQLN